MSQRRRRLVNGLRLRKTREREGLVLVEGVRAVREALDAGAEVAFAYSSPRLEVSAPGRALRERMQDEWTEAVTDDDLGALSDTRTPQGALLVCRQPRESLSDVTGDRLLVLDGVQDPGNVGTLVRSAVAFGLDGIVCLDGTADPWGAKTVRASAGLVFSRPVVVIDVGAALRHVQELGIPLLVSDTSGRAVDHHRGAPRFALALGNEGAGVGPRVREAAADVVTVPMTGPAESLNVGVAGSILMHTLTRGRGVE